MVITLNNLDVLDILTDVKITVWALLMETLLVFGHLACAA